MSNVMSMKPKVTPLTKLKENLKIEINHLLHIYEYTREEATELCFSARSLRFQCTNKDIERVHVRHRVIVF